MDNLSPASSVSAPTPGPALAEPAAAGFWLRAGAYMLDGLLVTVGQLILFGCLYLIGVPKTPANLVSSLLGIAYFVWMPMANSGQTVGKLAAGIAVARIDGAPLTWGRCLGRWAGYLASTLTLGLGFFIAAFTAQKRALQDYLAGTRVVVVAEISGLRKALLVLLALAPLALGVVAALAAPRFLQMATSANEESVRGRLNALRAAVAAYSRDNAGQVPPQLSALAPKYLPAIEAIQLKDHPAPAAAAAYDGSVCAGAAIDPSRLKDTGQWGYVADPAASCRGAVFVDCTHNDSRQKPWASY